MDLSKIERVITHGNCPDGMVSAIILYDALKIEPEFMTHNSNNFLKMEASPNILFCDISPPEDRYEEFISANAMVLDHHKGTQNIVEAFGKNGVFADEVLNLGVSGALLAFREVWMHKKSTGKEPIEALAILAGIRDTWQKQHELWPEACAQAAALTFYSWDYWKNKIDNCTGAISFSNELSVGRAIFNNRMLKAAKLAKEAFKFDCENYKVAVFNDADYYTSDVAEILRAEGCNVIAGFYYTKNDANDERQLICFSIRTDDTIDACELAQTARVALPGGGHKRAAGFSEVIYVQDISPFAIFQDIFEDYISYHQSSKEALPKKKKVLLSAGKRKKHAEELWQLPLPGRHTRRS
ncbi:MAG: hypothetical protein Q8P20_00350 [bacterium]|nr:hypothetical protein [bacterium]